MAGEIPVITETKSANGTSNGHSALTNSIHQPEGSNGTRTEFQLLDNPVFSTPFIKALDRIFINAAAKIDKKVEEVDKWEKDVQLVNGEVHRRDEQYDKYESQKALLIETRAEIMDLILGQKN